MQRKLKIEGIVLKKKAILGKDSVITCFTREKGKITLLAKGVRTIISKRLSSLLTGNLIDAICHQSGDRLYLQDVQIISLFQEIRKNEKRSKTLYFFLFLLDRLLPEGQQEPEVYNTFKHLLIELGRGEVVPARILYFLQHFLKLLGYGASSPDLHSLILSIEEIIGSKIPEHII